MSRQIAVLLRRFPLIMRLPYLFYRRAQSRYTIGVAAVVFDGNGRVLVVEHAYHPRLPWGLPGGWIDEDEEPALAIVRELTEELQLEATAVRALHIAKTVPHHIDLAFLCEAHGPIGALSHELLDYRWVETSALPALKQFHRRAIEVACELGHGGEPWERQ